MNDITPKEAIEILSHYTDLGYGIVIEGEDTSKIKQALSLASKTLANATPYNLSGDLISREALKEAVSKVVAEERKEDEKWATGLRYALKLIDNAQAVNTDVVADNVITAHENIGYEKGFNDGYAKCVEDNERPQGDCISREAINSEIEKRYCSKHCVVPSEEPYCPDNCPARFLKNIVKECPTVEHSLLPLSGEADNAYMRGYEVGKAEGILKASTRSHGEWKHLGGDEWVCSECGHVITTEGSWQNPLSTGAYHCENCGAKMKGGAE